jgi:Zn-dependent peptidase ImmA (M78 family)
MMVDMSKVSKLTKAYIDRKAGELLNEWAEFSGEEVRPPIPVEAIIEKYLGLTLEYDDLEEMLNIPGVLGATWVDERRVVVNSSLLGGIEGRIAFTCGHEIAHWILHRNYFFEIFARTDLPQPFHLPTIVCRTSTSKLRGEWQADYFSSCLMMPEKDVNRAFVEVFGTDPLMIYNRKSCFGRHNPFALDPALDTVKDIAQEVIKKGPFTNVSKEAMVYRLHGLGLLINRAESSFTDHFKRMDGLYSRNKIKGKTSSMTRR